MKAQRHPNGVLNRAGTIQRDVPSAAGTAQSLWILHFVSYRKITTSLRSFKTHYQSKSVWVKKSNQQRVHGKLQNAERPCFCHPCQRDMQEDDPWLLERSLQLSELPQIFGCSASHKIITNQSKINHQPSWNLLFFYKVRDDLWLSSWRVIWQLLNLDQEYPVFEWIFLLNKKRHALR